MTENGRVRGMLTLTDLIRHQSLSDIFLVMEIAEKRSTDDLADVISNVPQLLAQLNGAGFDADKIGRIITSITDALTVSSSSLPKLGGCGACSLSLACLRIPGPARADRRFRSGQLPDPVRRFRRRPACGYFEKFAKFVSDGLDACGYYYCPGEMMATTARWRQPVGRWREYFRGWIAQPDPMAQMLASVMFDLRPIAGDHALFEGLVEETLSLASANTIFRAHMISNSLKHVPPLGVFGGLSPRPARRTQGYAGPEAWRRGADRRPGAGLCAARGDQRGEHAGPPASVHRREDGQRKRRPGPDRRLSPGRRSASGSPGRRVRAGAKPDNFMSPSALSELERSHLRDAFVVIKTMQSALAQSHATLR